MGTKKVGALSSRHKRAKAIIVYLTRHFIYCQAQQRKIKMNKILIPSITIILALISSSCSFMKRAIGIPLKSETISVTQEWPHVKGVAIFLNNEVFNHYFSEDLLSRVPWKVVTRKQFEKVIKEHDIDSKSACEFGKSANIDAVFIGRVQTKRYPVKYGADYISVCEIHLIDCQSGSTLYSGKWQDAGHYNSNNAIKNLALYASKHFR